ncbi:maleylpyruvate isomerase family mycothiol-dependent enzyme [Streptomyces sp. NPDC051909]|uniref:maleylpyruvate isomerase family mycothiol-dependent enzyme n=1 Tax=Streptomyces sp. NPDC051909 TaxID=3154944 RepID=UPI0034243C8E
MPIQKQLILARDIPIISRRQAADLVEREAECISEILSSLSAEDWHRPTDCTLWEVRDVVAHMTGLAEDFTDPAINERREQDARTRYPERGKMDAENEVQVDDRRTLPDEKIADEFARVLAQAVQVERGMSESDRRRTNSLGIPVAYLADVVHSRDLWMHRIDICRAIGRQIAHKPHQDQIISQVMRELSMEWQYPALKLELTDGSDSRTFQIGTGEPRTAARTNSIEYMRMLSGRDPQPPIQLLTGDEQAIAALAAARVPF